MSRYKIFARCDEIIASIARNKEEEQAFLHKGYTLIGIAKIDDKFDVMGVRMKGGDGSGEWIKSR